MKFVLASLLAITTNLYAQTSLTEPVTEAIAETEHYLTKFSPHCMMADDEVHPQWGLELAEFSQEQLEAIMEKEFKPTSSYGSDPIPYSCSENPDPAPEALQKAFEAKNAHYGTNMYDYGDAKDNPCKLTKAEHIAIRIYTGSGYSDLNSSIRNKAKDPNYCMNYGSMIAVLNGALSKIKPHNGFVKRNVSLPAAVLELYKPGQVIREHSFWSTSTNASLFQSRNTRLIILGKNCVNVDVHSASHGEKEVLCPAGSEFVVMARKKISDGYYGGVETILLEQIK